MENKSINIKLNCLVKMSQAEAREHINTVLEAISANTDGLLSCKNYVSKDKSDEIEEILLTFKSASISEEFLSIINNSGKMVLNDFVICSSTVSSNEDSFEISNGLEDLTITPTLVHASTVDSMYSETGQEREELKKCNPKLEFYFNKAIDDDDVDAIIMFLENKRCSGGGDMDEFEFDAKKKLLLVKYHSYTLKQRVLAKRHFKFQDYAFTANEPFSSVEFLSDLKTLILRKFRNGEDRMNVQLYAENLVDDEDNDVVWIKASRLFEETYFVNFKANYSMDKVQKRLQRKPTLHGHQIEALPAILTNTCIVIQPSNAEKKVSIDVLELYFQNKKRSGLSSFDCIYDKGAYALIRLDTEENLRTILDRKHMISNQEVIVEYLYNLELLNELKPPSGSPQIEQQITGSEREVVPESPRLNEHYQKPVVEIDLSNEENSKCLRLWNGYYLEKLSNLGEVSLSGNILRIVYNDKIEFTQASDVFTNDWQMFVTKKLECLLGQFKSHLFESFVDEKIIDNLKYDKNSLSFERIGDAFEVFGINEQVDSVVRQIEALTQKMTEHEVGNLTKTQIRILYVNKFTTKMNENFPDLEVKINAKTGSIRLAGYQNQIDQARSIIQSIFDGVVMKSRSFDPIMLKFFNQERYLADVIREREFQCVLEISKDSQLLNIYSTNEAKINDFWKFVDCELKQVDLDLGIVEDKAKLKEICTEMETQPDLVFLINADTNTIQLGGFGETLEFYYSQLICI